MIIDVYPARTLNEPGAQATIRLDIESEGDAEAQLRLEVLERTEVVWQQHETVRLTKGLSIHEVSFEAPVHEARGYSVRAELTTETTSARAYTALLVASHWRFAPRYGFLSEFAPDDLDNGRVKELAKFHITCVQFYDWMYRHYQLLPPSDTFKDALGRELSLQTVRSRIGACHRHGMAALAYGAVYGPEPEFILEHPDWLLYDTKGDPIELTALFYITDLRAGSAWREHILREYEACVSELGFDGIHMDQYGFPKLAYDHEGTLVDLSRDFPGMINEAAARLAAKRKNAGVLFNAVNNWPIDAVAQSNQEAVYIEVWSPHDHYRDLVHLIQRARDLSGKQVILSAYLKPFVEGGDGAEWAARYITAVIASAGGHHLILGEGHAVLRDAYYPNHGWLSAEGVATLRRYYDHTAAYTHYLHPHHLRVVESSFATGVNTTFSLEGAPVSTVPKAGKVWLSIKQREGQFVINLVNLCSLQDSLWDTPHRKAETIEGLTLECEPFIRLRQATWATPDEDRGMRILTWQEMPQGRITLRLPTLEVWTTLILDYG